MSDPQAAAAAMAEAWEHLAGTQAGGWSRSQGGALAAVTGVGLPTLNAVLVPSLEAPAEVVEGLLAEVAASGLPHCLQVRPAGAERFADLARSRGMIPEGAIPLMVHERPGAVGIAGAAEGLVIRELPPAQADLHARLLADGFQAPLEPFLELMTPALLAAPGVRCYVGELDGHPVTTGLGLTLGSHVGIFNIATPPAHRGQGYAAAVSARAAADGVHAGASFAWLQASPAGYPVYQRLGFRTAEEWPCWLSP